MATTGAPAGTQSPFAYSVSTTTPSAGEFADFCASFHCACCDFDIEAFHCFASGAAPLRASAAAPVAPRRPRARSIFGFHRPPRIAACLRRPGHRAWRKAWRDCPNAGQTRRTYSTLGDTLETAHVFALAAGKGCKDRQGRNEAAASDQGEESAIHYFPLSLSSALMSARSASASLPTAALSFNWFRMVL